MICDLCLKKGKGICVAISEDKIFEAPCDKEGHCMHALTLCIKCAESVMKMIKAKMSKTESTTCHVGGGGGGAGGG